MKLEYETLLKVAAQGFTIAIAVIAVICVWFLCFGKANKNGSDS